MACRGWVSRNRVSRRNWGLLLAGAPLVLALGGAPASAADLSVQAMPVFKAPVAAPFSWTGWYIGANAGYGVGQGGGTDPFGDTFNAIPAGAFGGGQLGYNYQFGSFVIGAETDIQGGGISVSRRELSVIQAQDLTVDQKLNWFGTTRARVGIVSGPILTYVTAGAAYGGVDAGFNFTTGAGPVGAAQTSATRTGWTWGTGVEAALGGNWSAKAEYLYIDLGTTSASNPAVGTMPLSVKTQEQVFRGGINYHFGPEQTPVFAPARNWAGFFVGGTVGAGIGNNSSTYTDQFVASDTFSLSPRGWNLGGIAGYNWQFGNWVVGVEGDFQGNTDGTGYVTSFFDGATVDQKLSWFGTARGRFGYGIGNALFYATGGAAWGAVKDSVTPPGSAASTFSHTQSGFAVGGGIENKFDLFGLLGPNWTTRTEYLFVDLGSVNDTAGASSVTSKINEHIWRTVVSYKFGTP